MNGMAPLLKKILLPATVFLTGACVLIVEVVATRILSPYFGNTIFTYSSVISVILAALSVGYYTGGKIADRHPTFQWFFACIAVSGLLLLASHALSLYFLPAVSRSTSIMIGPLISSLLFFFFPSLILGTLSPYAVVIQKQLDEEIGIGSIAGRMFFWSTLGSIAGSLSAGFIFIPLIGTNQIMTMNGVALFLIGCIPLAILRIQRKYLFLFIGVCVMLIGAIFYHINQTNASNIIYQKDGVYEQITILESTVNGRPVRSLKQDHTDSGAIYLDTNDPTDTVYPYASYVQLYKLTQQKPKRILSIGGGTYTVASIYQTLFPDARIDAVEIEPSLRDLAKTYFRLHDSPNLHIETEDGRRFLERSDGDYDIIFSDVYRSYFSIPSHMVTKEFYSAAKIKLAPQGIFIANVLGDLSRQEPSLFFNELKTFQQVFPNMAIFAVQNIKNGPQNFIFVGFNSNEPVDFHALAKQHEADPFIKQLPDHLLDLRRFELHPYAVMTDDYAPTDYDSARTIQRIESAPQGFDGNEMLALAKQQSRYENRSKGSEGNTLIRNMIETELSAQSKNLDEQAFISVAAHSNFISAYAYPEQTKRIIFAARYDLKADEAGSGTAVLLHLANILSRLEAPPPIGIDLIFFESGDEDPLHILKNISKQYPSEEIVFIDSICDPTVTPSQRDAGDISIAVIQGTSSSDRIQGCHASSFLLASQEIAKYFHSDQAK